MELDAIAESLLRLLDTGATHEPIRSEARGFSVGDPYAVTYRYVTLTGRSRRIALATEASIMSRGPDSSLVDVVVRILCSSVKAPG